jgi:predicted Fe-Mo cluster-binding NifX family protein
MKKNQEINLKIAIVSDDHETISAHFGMANFYEVFTIEAGQVVSRETINKSNPQLVMPAGQIQTEGEHHHHDHNAMLAPIADCQVLLTRGMGRGAHLSLQEHDIQPIITDIREILPAVQAFLGGTLIDHPERLH